MDGFLFASILTSRLWYALPLIVAISLVYAATRHELMVPILTHALRIGLWIIAFMVVIFLIMLLVSWWL